jgi:hypothetical protein
VRHQQCPKRRVCPGHPHHCCHGRGRALGSAPPGLLVNSREHEPEQKIVAHAGAVQSFNRGGGLAVVAEHQDRVAETLARL